MVEDDEDDDEDETFSEEETPPLITCFRLLLDEGVCEFE